MAFSGNHITNSFKKEVLAGTHNFTLTTGSVFKLALYTSSASFNAATTDYTTTNEVSGTGYSAGGAALTNITPTNSGSVGVASFAALTFSSVSLTARGALIYNSTAGTNAVMILDFGRDIIRSAADLVITFPTADSGNAIIRIA